MKIKSWKAQNLCKEFVLLWLLLGHGSCVLFFKALMVKQRHVGKTATFFKSPWAIKFFPTTCMLTARFCNLEPLRGGEHCSWWLKRKRQRHPKWCLLSLVELILYTFPVTPQFNQKSKNFTLRMWVLCSSDWKVLFCFQIITPCASVQSWSFLFGTKKYSPNREHMQHFFETLAGWQIGYSCFQNGHKSTLSACVFRSLYLG